MVTQGTYVKPLRAGLSRTKYLTPRMSGSESPCSMLEGGEKITAMDNPLDMSWVKDNRHLWHSTIMKEYSISLYTNHSLELSNMYWSRENIHIWKLHFMVCTGSPPVQTILFHNTFQSLVTNHYMINGDPHPIQDNISTPGKRMAGPHLWGSRKQSSHLNSHLSCYCYIYKHTGNFLFH